MVRTIADDEPTDDPKIATDGGQPDDVLVALSLYGDVERDAIAVTVEDDPDVIASVVDRAHRHGYVVDESRDATEDVRPVERRLRFVRAEESEFDTDAAAPQPVTDGGIIVAGDEGVILEDDGGDDAADPDDEGVELLPDGGRPPLPSFDHAPDVGPSDVDKCRECGRYAPHAFDHNPDCSRYEAPAEADADPARENPRMAVPATDGGADFVNKPDQSDELIASGITAATVGDVVDVWADIDGERTVVSGVVASHGRHDKTEVVAFDTFGDPGDRVAVRFTRVINPGTYPTVDDAVLFDPHRGDTFTVCRVERR